VRTRLPLIASIDAPPMACTSFELAALKRVLAAAAADVARAEGAHAAAAADAAATIDEEAATAAARMAPSVAELGRAQRVHAALRDEYTAQVGGA
jgi:hypothetical protein